MKWYEALGMGIFAIIGFVFGLALFSLLYGWYLLGFSNSETVLFIAVVLILVMYVFISVAYLIGKKYKLAAEKAIWLGVGFTIALIIAGIILGYLGLTTSVTIAT